MLAAQEAPINVQRMRLDALYKAAIVADQNAKLSVFATRPGIRSPVFNWIVVRFDCRNKCTT